MKNHHTRLLFAFLLLAVSARAHFVWLERDAATGAVAAYFGEWSDNLRETQDGYLKLIAAPQAFSADGRELPVAIQHDRSATTARFDLELVPTAPGSNIFTLLLRGQPLPNIGVTLFPSGKGHRGRPCPVASPSRAAP